jgi:hypothetical protein
VSSVCQMGRPCRSQRSCWIVEFPPGSVEFQHLSEESIVAGALVAHMSERVPLLSRESPSRSNAGQ